VQTLALAMRAGSSEGLALPCPIKGLGNCGAHLRRGQVSLWGGASGAGKSAIATHIAVHSAPRIPTLYLSADSDKTTLGVRVGASVTNTSIDIVEQSIREGDIETWNAIEEQTNHIWFYWDAQPSCVDLYEEVQAYAYVNGAWPHLIVVDNLINIDAGDEGASHQQKDAVMHWLQQLANTTNAHVMVLHHVTGSRKIQDPTTREWREIFYEDGSMPVPKSALLDKVAKRPRLVVTLFRESENLLGVRIVKNSSGPASADASYGFSVAWRPEKCYLRG